MKYPQLTTYGILGGCLPSAYDVPLMCIIFQFLLLSKFLKKHLQLEIPGLSDDGWRTGHDGL